MAVIDLIADTATIPDLYNTGVDDDRVKLEAGCQDDTHWSVVGAAEAKVLDTSILPPSWKQDDVSDLSRWVSSDCDILANADTPTLNEYVTTFTMPGGATPSAFTLVGRVMADNSILDILVNDVSSGETAGMVSCMAYDSWVCFKLTTGFQAGANTITFKVADKGLWEGLRVEFLFATY